MATTPVDTDEPDAAYRRRRRALATVAAVALLIGAGFLVTAWFDDDSDYPPVDTASLTSVQQRIVEVTRTEFCAQPDGTKYSGGVEEQWCADFVSWVMNEAGRPFTNPNSDSWRIPGVYTLTEYLQAENRFHAADSGYHPSLGDVMLYTGDSKFGQHTNIVLRVDGDRITTVGGNEQGRIRIGEFTIGKDAGLVGFGEP